MVPGTNSVFLFQHDDIEYTIAIENGLPSLINVVQPNRFGRGGIMVFMPYGINTYCLILPSIVMLCYRTILCSYVLQFWKVGTLFPKEKSMIWSHLYNGYAMDHRFTEGKQRTHKILMQNCLRSETFRRVVLTIVTL